jgi:hypothetical protein
MNVSNKMKSKQTFFLTIALALCGAVVFAAEPTEWVEHASDSYESDINTYAAQPMPMDDGCCDTCEQGCEDECGPACGSCFFAGGEYLHLRTHFSEAVAFATVTDGLSNQGFNRQVIAHELDFDYESSFRVFLGFHLTDCCDVRFTYWYLDTDTNVTGVAGPGQTIVDPFGNLGLVGSSINTMAAVNMDVYDIEFQRPVDFACGGIGFLYSAGVRFADVEQFYNSEIAGPTGVVTGEGRFDVDFFGIGPYLGVKGQTFHGACDQFSLFARGATALLVGQYDITTRVAVPGASGSQGANRVRMVPVLESEIGASWQPSDRFQLSAGWMFAAWFNLGASGGTFDGERLPVAPVDTAFGGADDADIMSFDGLFVRAQIGY